MPTLRPTTQPIFWRVKEDDSSGVTLVGEMTAVSPTVTLVSGEGEMGYLAAIAADGDGYPALPEDVPALFVAWRGDADEALVGEHTSGQGAAGEGATVAVYQSVLAAQLTSGGTITVTLGANVDARSAIAGYWTIGKASVAVAGLATQATDGADPAAMTLADLPSREYLFIGAHAYKGPYGSDSYAADGAFSVIADAGGGAFGIGTTGGGAVTNQSVGAGYRILTGTGTSYDATIANNRDSAGLFIALYEVDEELIEALFRGMARGHSRKMGR